ncbi:MAG: polysaccharide deacetylase family protein [Dethiobacteria bacterium]|jgi:probable sporulation protein (polysaccharide deacetylase family)|nr:polysaccharide deacetylase family protein [Bacillota bacterium]
MSGADRKKRVWRWAAFFLLLTAAVAVLYFQFDEPLRRHFHGVKAGVTLQGKPVERLLRPEVAAIVSRMAAYQGREAVSAQLEPEKERIIPELNGLELDQEATVDLVMKAPPGVRVNPLYYELLPPVRWDHYPALPAEQGNPRKPCVSLMINVAWGEEELPEMLRVLQKEDARATFFLVGRWAEQNEALIGQIAAGGHELGNHGYSDDETFTELDAWSIARSIRQTNEIIFDAAGCYPLYFTPHKGEYNRLTLEIVSRQGMRTVLWSLDTVDWQKPGLEVMREKIIRNLAPGKIILMHPTAETVELLREILPSIKGKGLSVVTVSELLAPDWWQ